MTTAIFNKDNSNWTTAESVWQWDYGQMLRIQGLDLPQTVEVHFSKTEESGDSVTRIGVTKDGVTDVRIPDSALEVPGNIYAFVYQRVDNAGETEYEIMIPLKARPKPEVPGGTEEGNMFEEVLETVNKAAEDAKQSETNALQHATDAQDAAYRAENSAQDALEHKNAAETAAAEAKKMETAVQQAGAEIAQMKEDVVQKSAEVSADAQTVAEDREAAGEYAAQAKASAEKTAADAKATAEDRAIVEQAVKDFTESAGTAVQELENAIEEAGTAKTELEKTTGAANTANTQLQGTIDAAGTVKTGLTEATTQAATAKQNLDASVTAAGTALESLTDANTAAAQTVKSLQDGNLNGQKTLEDIRTEGETQLQNIHAAGAEEVQKVQGAAAEIVADREQIGKNTEDIATLKEDVSDLKISAYTDTFFKNFFAMQKSGKKYTVRFPLWETSQVPTGEKLDDNEGLVLEPSTLTEKGRDDYENIPLFKTYDCNVEKIDGKLKITAMKGDVEYDPNEKDTFVLGMPYYHKAWEQDGYLYYSRSDTQHEGYVLCPEARKTEGMRNFCLYGKYVAGKNSKGVLGSYSGVKPERSLFSYNANINESKKLGEEYCFGSSYDYAYIQTTFLLKYANKNWNTILGGCFSYSYQYSISVPEQNTKRVVLKKADADRFIVGSFVSVGDPEDISKAPDRGNVKAHNLCDSVKILNIVEVDENNKALILDIPEEITTTATTWVSAMYWRSGFSGDINGRDGCPCQARSQITSMMYPSVIQGIEIAVGGYEVPGNTFMDIINEIERDVYVCTDSSKLTTNVTTAKETYLKLAKQMTVEKAAAWCYATEIFIDTDNGINIITKSGASGSGSSTGFCDAIYFDTSLSGQREFHLLGLLGNGSFGGAFYAYCYGGLGHAWWSILARLSLNVFRGEFA